MHETPRSHDRDLTVADLLPVVLRKRAAAHPRTIPFEYHQSGSWRPVTTVDHVQRVDELAAGLIVAGVRPGDRVAIMSATRYDWVVADMAVWTAGAVSVPVYPSSSAAQLEWILQDSGAVLLLAETEAHEELIGSVTLPDTCREVHYIEYGDLDVLRSRGREIDPDEVDTALATLTLESPASIVYTSGTTGRPKGCVLTHANLLAECHALHEHPIGAVGCDGGKLLMFLPLAHVLARSVTYTILMGHGTVGFWPDTATLVPQLAEFRPHLILGVPRVFEKVHDAIAAKARAGGPVPAAVFEQADTAAIDRSRRIGGSGLGDAVNDSALQKAQLAVYDRLVFRAVREALGGRCEYAISGGGALPDRTAHFFRGAGVPVYEGYGLTETTAAITTNGPGCQRIGTVGRVIGSNEVRIADDGEVIVRGPVVFTRYWNDESATAAALDHGWFATGDLGALDTDGYLRITGRKKEIIVTAGGKNVSPGPMEEALRAHRLIGHAVVLGEGRRFVTALLALDPEELERWAEANGHAGACPETLCADPSLRSEIQFAVDDANAAVSHAEGIKRFALLPSDVSEETGELTATLKIRRHVVEQKYSREIGEMYA